MHTDAKLCAEQPCCCKLAQSQRNICVMLMTLHVPVSQLMHDGAKQMPVACCHGICAQIASFHLCFACLYQTEALPLKVSGSIPSWLKGSYVRNGPGTFKGVKHLFDGYGMIVKFAFENGKVSTQQRYVQP